MYWVIMRFQCLCMVIRSMMDMSKTSAKEKNRAWRLIVDSFTIAIFAMKKVVASTLPILTAAMAHVKMCCRSLHPVAQLDSLTVLLLSALQI